MNKTVVLSVMLTSVGVSDTVTDDDLDFTRQRQDRDLVLQVTRPTRLGPSDYPFVVLDVETTGFLPSRDHIIEVGAVRFDWDESVGEVQTPLTYLIHSMTNIPKHIRELTGITNEVVQEEGVSIEKALSHLDQLISDARIIAYNADFDRRFLTPVASRLGLEFLNNTWVDVLPMTRKALPKPVVGNHQLSTIAKYYGIDANFHRALADATTTAAIYKNTLSEVGQDAELPPRRELEQECDLDSESSSEMFALELSGETFVFTGFRDQILESRIHNAGGIVKGHISKKVTRLLVQTLDDIPTGKVKKAHEYQIEMEEKDHFKRRFYVFT